MKCPVEFFAVLPYVGEVSPEDRATLRSDPGAGGLSGEEREAARIPFPMLTYSSDSKGINPGGHPSPWRMKTAQ